MKFTPGPWHTAFDDNENPYGCVYSEGTNIALIVHERDAALIAAAPELLEALKLIIRPNYGFDTRIENYDKAKQAITKAESLRSGVER